MLGEPYSPNDLWAQSFLSSDEWRAEADKWESLANGASLDGDARQEKYCRENAAACRHNARVRAMTGGASSLSQRDAGEIRPMAEAPQMYAAQIQHNDGSWHQLDDLTVIHVLRNPGGWTEDAVRQCRLFAATVLEDRSRRWNMFAPKRVRDGLERIIKDGPKPTPPSETDGQSQMSAPIQPDIASQYAAQNDPELLGAMTAMCEILERNARTIGAQNNDPRDRLVRAIGASINAVIFREDKDDLRADVILALSSSLGQALVSYGAPATLPALKRIALDQLHTSIGHFQSVLCDGEGLPGLPRGRRT